MAEKTLLEIKNLSIAFGKNEVIHNMSYQLNQNEILGIVGESGSGKSVSSLAILGLLPKNISKITSGSILFENQDLTRLNSKQFQAIRGKKNSHHFSGTHEFFKSIYDLRKTSSRNIVTTHKII